MTLEELIYKRISESAAAERLALHNGAPAVFFGPVPTDTDRAGLGLNSTRVFLTPST